MIVKTNESFRFRAHYTASGANATGLTVTATVYNPNGTTSTPAVTHLGSGVYQTAAITPTVAGQWTCVFDTAGTADQRNVAAGAWVAVAGVDSLDYSIATLSGEIASVATVASDTLVSADAASATAQAIDAKLPSDTTTKINRLDVAISTRAAATDLTTLSGYVDTEVAAIKAKTDNLPSDPADQSLLMAAIGAIESGDVVLSVASVYPNGSVPATGDLPSIRRGDSYPSSGVVQLDDLPDLSAATAVWITAKPASGLDYPDSEADFQVSLAGLQRIAKSAPATGQTGTLAVVGGTSVRLTLAAGATAALTPGDLRFDLQAIIAGVVTTVAEGNVEVVADVTRATS